MQSTFHHNGDQMIRGPFAFETRPKVVHTKGVIAKVTLDVSNADPHPFTGVYRTGCHYGFIRLGSGIEVKKDNLL